VARGARELLPAVWLLLYGTSLRVDGIVSVPVIRRMGWGFVLLGFLAAFAPPPLGNVLMAGGFWLLHVAFGVVVVRRYGG